MPRSSRLPRIRDHVTYPTLSDLVDRLSLFEFWRSAGGGGDERNRGAFSLTHEFVILGNLGGTWCFPNSGFGPGPADNGLTACGWREIGQIMKYYVNLTVSRRSHNFTSLTSSRVHRQGLANLSTKNKFAIMFCTHTFTMFQLKKYFSFIGPSQTIGQLILVVHLDLNVDLKKRYFRSGLIRTPHVGSWCSATSPWQ